MAKKSKISASRGSVNNIILNSLLSGDKYGYEIIKEVEQETNGKVKLKQPSLYSSLKRFEQKGYITSYWGDSDIGGRRHYYSITPLGRANSQRNKKNTFTPTQPIKDEQPDIKEDTIIEQLDDNEYLFEFDEEEEDTEVTIQKRYSSFNVDDKINELLYSDELTETEEKEYVTEILDAVEKIAETYPEPAEQNDEQTEEVEPDLIYDHHFYKSTPLTQMEAQIQTQDEEDLANTVNEEVIEITERKEEVIEKPKKKIITDEYGITKILYEDEVKPTTQKVFDNVKFRTAPLQNVYDSSEKIKTHKTLYDDISDEERELKNKKFMQKFDSITQEKNTEPFSKDYKNKLNSLYSDDSGFNEEPEVVNYTQPTYYENEEKFEQPVAYTNNATADVFNSSEYNIKRYQKNEGSSFKSNYLLINKAKFIFGIVMLVLMILQITVTMILLKQNNLLFDKHFSVYQIAYTITALVTLYYCIPVFISPNKQASSPFKFKYSLMFGLLAFFVSLLLIYSINTFMGLDYSNFKFFLTPLLVPSILVSNFVFGPIIFKVITLNKKLY